MNKEEKESSLIRKLIKLNARFEEKERERKEGGGFCLLCWKPAGLKDEAR